MSPVLEVSRRGPHPAPGAVGDGAPRPPFAASPPDWLVSYRVCVTCVPILTFAIGWIGAYVRALGPSGYWGFWGSGGLLKSAYTPHDFGLDRFLLVSTRSSKAQSVQNGKLVYLERGRGVSKCLRMKGLSPLSGVIADSPTYDYFPSPPAPLSSLKLPYFQSTHLIRGPSYLNETLPCTKSTPRLSINP